MRYIILLLIIPTQLFAYIDPGTGSLLVSTLVGLGAALVFSLKGFFYGLIGRLTGKRVKATNDFTGKLVFFNEGKKYWNVFKPVLDKLIEKGHEFVYLSADKEDPGLNIVSDKIEMHYLGEINQAVLILNRLKADTVVMTTPQLNILTLKRSNDVRHYCHLLHAPADIHTYKKYAFDYFDSVLCSSKFQIENIRQLENDRNKPHKQLFETGCTYYDLTEESNSGGDAILLSPTWGNKSFMKEKGNFLIEELLSTGNKIIFRPHPQSWTAEPEFIQEIIEKYKENKNFEVDDRIDNSYAISNSKIVVCDISGIIYDIAFVHKKPVIAINKNDKPKCYEAYSIKNRQSLLDLLEDIGKVITMDEIEKIPEMLTEVLNTEINEKIIAEHIFNFRNSGEIATEQILGIYSQNRTA